MKFLIVLACVAMASAVGNYRSSHSSYSSGGSLGGLGGSLGASYGGILGGGYGSNYGASLGGGYGSNYGASLGGGYGSNYGASYGAGLSGLNLGGYSGAGLTTAQAVPVTLVVAQPAAASYSAGIAGGRAHSGGLIEAAVISNRQVQVVDVPSTPVDAAPAQVVIPPTVQGVNLEFQSQSSPVTVTANHIPGAAQAPQEYSHQEEADIVRQNIVKPVIHEVNEVITPFRRVSQEVKPVQEELNQVLATGHREVYRAQNSVNTQVAAQPTVLALVANGASTGLLSGASRGVSTGASYGLAGGYGARSIGTGSLSTGYSTGVRSSPTILIAGNLGSAGLGGYSTGLGGYSTGLGGYNTGLGGSIQRSSSYSSRSGTY